MSAALLFTCGLLGAACTQPTGFSANDDVVLEPPPKAVATEGLTYLSLGNRLLAAREPDLAMRAFLSSLSAEGVSAEAMTGAGISLQQQGLLNSARRYFEQARELAPDSVITHNNLGVVLYMLKEYYPAREEFRAAYALSSGKSEKAERNLNHLEATIAAIEQAAETDPTTTYDVVRLGSSEFRLVESPSPELDAMEE